MGPTAYGSKFVGPTTENQWTGARSHTTLTNRIQDHLDQTKTESKGPNTMKQLEENQKILEKLLFLVNAPNHSIYNSLIYTISNELIYISTDRLSTKVIYQRLWYTEEHMQLSVFTGPFSRLALPKTGLVHFEGETPPP